MSVAAQHNPMTHNTSSCSDDDVKLLDVVAEGIFQYMVVALSANKLNITKPDIKLFFVDRVEPNLLSTLECLTCQLTANTQSRPALNLFTGVLKLALKYAMWLLLGTVRRIVIW